jgi:hypothetical protein
MNAPSKCSMLDIQIRLGVLLGLRMIWASHRQESMAISIFLIYTVHRKTRKKEQKTKTTL